MAALRLDGLTIESREALHRQLADGLQLPADYGCNLDALHDCLTDLHEPVTIAVTNTAALQAALGSYALSFYRVLHDSMQENSNLTVLWEKDISKTE